MRQISSMFNCGTTPSYMYLKTNFQIPTTILCYIATYSCSPQSDVMFYHGIGIQFYFNNTSSVVFIYLGLKQTTILTSSSHWSLVVRKLGPMWKRSSMIKCGLKLYHWQNYARPCMVSTLQIVRLITSIILKKEMQSI